MNWDNSEVRNAVFEMMNWWFDKGIDGFRVDAITHIKKTFEAGDLPLPEGKSYAPAFDVDMNQPGIQPWLQEMKDKSLSQYDIMTVGEANGVNPDNAKEWVGEEEECEHLGFYRNSKFDFLQNYSLAKTYVGWNALFIENHDQPRRVSTWGDDKQFGKSATSHCNILFTARHTIYISRSRNRYD